MDADTSLSRLAGAIAEPARARMLCALLDGHARTSTELSVVAQVSPSTASAHLARLSADGLLHQVAQGKHRYYRLAGADVARALEALLVLAAVPRAPFRSPTPTRLQNARTCYDHMAGAFAVAMHDLLIDQGWITPDGDGADGDINYLISEQGTAALNAAGIDVAALCAQRRRLACPCLDWSERRPHVAGALGAALLRLALQKGWVTQDLDSRALGVHPQGWRRLLAHFQIGASASLSHAASHAPSHASSHQF